ncbi:hypothetical protein M422DRAFT_256785 [Sphaerobolus stellatus SS14]|uniref:Uncharacterized protein n=1 Tax=Sphaerobolus stellatus (strain SS14) TaxID=990650 RepID=A0A0C9UZE4_SPHS4|nr:hypothetical protein M422DRAFT_256785 [Sphaerobolus stellatus SS14]
MALIDGHDAAKEQKSAGAKAKASKEQQAALELHDAAMMAHEKQGQRADKENCAPSASKHVQIKL